MELSARRKMGKSIAIVLTHIGARSAADLLSVLPPDERTDVVTRIAEMEEIRSYTRSRMEDALVEQIKLFLGGDVSKIGGVGTVNDNNDLSGAETDSSRAETAADSDNDTVNGDDAPRGDEKYLSQARIDALLSYGSDYAEKSVFEGFKKEYPKLATEIEKLLITFERVFADFNVVEERSGWMEDILATHIYWFFGKVSGIDGAKSATDILSNMDSGAVKDIISDIERGRPALAAKIKENMLVFESILLFDDRLVQRLIEEIDKREIALALSKAPEELQEKFFKNMSPRVSTMIREDMRYIGPIRDYDYEEARRRIADTMRYLCKTNALCQ